MQQNFEEISSSYGKQYLSLAEECLYKCDQNRGNLIYLRCIEKGCRCRALIKDCFFERKNCFAHNHPSHRKNAQYEIAFSALRRSVVQRPRQSLRNLHSEFLENPMLTRDIAMRFSWKQKRRNLQRIRNMTMPACNSLAEMTRQLEDTESAFFKSFGCIREHKFYQATINGQPLFANLAIIEDLPLNFEMSVDGTFSVTPFSRVTRQLLVILGEIRNRLRPLVYVIMIGQTQEDYKQIFTYLRDTIFGLGTFNSKPTSVVCDFEQSIRSALNSTWEGIRIVGCNFHLNQSLYRKAVEVIPGGKVQVSGGTIHHKTLLMFMRLSLLPIDRIERGFEAIMTFMTENGIEDDFERFVSYFKNTWFIRFPKKTWCVGDRVRRTNNELEGYNNYIKNIIQKNPSVINFMQGLHYMALDALTNYDAEIHHVAPANRSLITPILQEASIQLQNGLINELTFLKKLSGFD